MPFPYTDRDTRQRRPALVVSEGGVGPHGAQLWVVMITSADNPSWPTDVAIPDHLSAGLPAPSVVRPAKIATVDVRDAGDLGRAPAGVLRKALEAVRQTLG